VSDVALIAWGAVSALGEGSAAVSAGIAGEPARHAIGHDDELARAGLARPFAARASVPPGVDDRSSWLLARALAACVDDLDRVRPSWRTERVGLVVGTSSGGMRDAERVLSRLAEGEAASRPESATYYGPVAHAVRESGLAFDPALVVLGACASSVLAIGLAIRCLARGDCDVVLAGGFDDVTTFVAAGFEALRATTASPPPRPFRIGRDGMALGEGAGLVALVCAPRGEQTSARAFVTGFGAAQDAVHLTAPDREGRGLSRAVEAALDEAGRPRIDLVSPHATATPFNDPVEAHVLARALGEPGPVVAPFKAQIGHTLGAAGVLETLHCVDALERGVLPASAGQGEIDPQASVRLLERCDIGPPRTALKLASAFGGSNAALVVGTVRGPRRAMRPAFVSAGVHVASAEPLERGDGLVHLALGAVEALRASGARIDGAGIVVGSPLATLETNALFAARIRERGARMAEPRRFPYTSPNAVAGACSIAFGLTGPGFSVGGGMHAGLEALAAAAWLVEAGDAESVVVVAVDEMGPASSLLGYGGPDGLRAGAVATLVSADPEGALGRVGPIHVARGPLAACPGELAPGHQALLPLVRPAPSRLSGALVLESGSPPDARALIALEPV
jgi:3-oxoacyl-[acyl-carrier-protein] synthase II